MRGTRRLQLLAAAVLASLSIAVAATAGGPIVTGVYDPGAFGAADSATAFARVRAAGASIVRLTVAWDQVAPRTRPADFHASDPADGAYDWALIDREVDGAVAGGLAPIVDLVGAPAWAQAGPQGSGSGPVRPAVSDVSAFASALARRYSGTFDGHPRVRYYQFWNEPNLSTNLMPQYESGIIASASWYRAALNGFAAAVRGVHPSNLIIAGGLAPYGIQRKGEHTSGVFGVAPMRFIQAMLCLSTGSDPRPTCRARSSFDVWSFHPYTWGDPTHKAYAKDDIAMGDIPRAQSLVRAAARAGLVRGSRSPQFWVTEFGWDTNPPDPHAIPQAIQARWTSEAIYRFWQDGIAVATWFLLRDTPYPASPFQSGLYRAGATIARDRAKLTLRAFRFPFVVFHDPGGYRLWGRTPGSTAATVVIELRRGRGWTRVASAHAGLHGVFTGQFASTLTDGSVRARLADGSDSSVPFSLRPVPDRRLSPFG